MTPRSEPLLWLQLIGLAAMPLELLLVLLLLAGSDPGPFPALERVLIWGMGAVGPAVLLWRQPPDPLSLLLLCTPQRQRSPDQLALTSEPVSLALKLLLASGAALLLPALWWLDTSSVLAHSFALLPGSSRLVSLLAVVPVLALLVWQWQQLVQATNLLIASGDGPATTTGGALEPRLCLGLPWLRLPGLDLRQPAKPEAAIPAALAAPEGPAPAGPEPLESAEPAATTEVVVATEVDVAAEVVETAERETVLETPDEETSEDQNSEAEPNHGESSDQASVDHESSHDSDVLPAEQEPEAQAEIEAVTEPEPEPEAEPQPETKAEAEQEADLNEPAAPAATLQNQQTGLREPEITDVAFTPVEAAEMEDTEMHAAPTDESTAVAIEPEQAAEEHQGPNLDEPIA